jgi:Short C-terminal domain
MIDQLSKLTALHGQGALTDAEFTAAKAKLLGDANG